VGTRKPADPTPTSPTAKRARPAKPRRAAAAALPDPRGDAPLHELGRDRLSVLLYVALLPEETKALVAQLGLTVPGFRPGALGDVERCDLLADEIRAAPEVRVQVLDALRKAFGRPPLVGVALDRAAADDLLAVGDSDHGLVLALWRVLADAAPAVRGCADPVLDGLVKHYFGPAPKEAGEAEPLRAAPGPDAAAARVKELEAALGRAEERAGSARKKWDEQRDKLQDWLKEARARAAQAVDEAARARESAEAAARAREKAEAALAAAQATDAAADAHRARAAARELEGKLAAVEARAARQAEREAELEAALRERRERPEPAPERAAAAGAEEADEPEEAPASWLMPVYTREFYDSLEGWDRRVQRAAFKQAHLLAQDHRHPSLRALPLEGLPGYYRVRVATDVRLLYRRTERQNTVEILSLIDREDLDRYVRQAKTRQ
jgi:mRNA-degrading endonuclease RelE of RelBE toxin-antitoxin system